MPKRTDQDLTDLVLWFIAQPKEGQFWDFKREHHQDSASLVHDILCLANTEHGGDRYIVFGVGEENTGWKMIKLDPATRRTQADMIDILRRARFAGRRAPTVSLRTVRVKRRIVDVLVVRDEPHKPYTLSDRFGKRPDKEVRPFHVYSRRLDTNTPIDSAADDADIERMWRERLGLSLPPRERMIALLRDPNWEKNLGNRDVAYHRLSPEYQVTFGEARENRDGFSYFFTNESAAVLEARFLYQTTELFTESVILCDGWRRWYPLPNQSAVMIAGEKIFYFYYDLSSPSGAFLHFLTDGTFDFTDGRGGTGPFLLFRNSEERRAFELHAAGTATADQLADAVRQERHVQQRFEHVKWPVWSAGGMRLLQRLSLEPPWRADGAGDRDGR